MMDAYYAVMVSILVMCLGVVIAQTEPAPTEDTPGVHCKTGKGLEGSCVPRRLCDYGTAAIDQTLYAPRVVKNPCRISGNPDELVNICCPHDSTVKVESTTKSWENDQDFNK